MLALNITFLSLSLSPSQTPRLSPDNQQPPRQQKTDAWTTLMNTCLNLWQAKHNILTKVMFQLLSPEGDQPSDFFPMKPDRGTPKKTQDLKK